MHVAFDIGRVLFQVNLDRFITVYNDLGFFHNKEAEVFLSDIHGQSDTGLTTLSRALRDCFEVDGDDLEKLLEAWDDAIEPEPKMIEFLQELKATGWRVALLSNIGIEHAKLIADAWPEVYAGCDVHLSCEVGARKPSKLYFQSFLWDYPEYAGCVYVDDLSKNRIMGQKYGFDSQNFNLELGDIENLPALRDYILKSGRSRFARNRARVY